MQGGGRATFLHCLLIVVTVFGFYGASLDNYWIKDDLNLHLVSSTRDVDWGHLRPFLWPSHLKSDQYWRPLPIAISFVEYAIYDIEPFGYHVSNTIFHALVAILLYVTVNRLLRSEDAKAGLFTALAFAVLPTNPEAIIWILQRMVLLCAAFSLTAILCRERAAATGRAGPLVLSYVFMLAAMFSKEVGATLPGVFFAIDLFYAPPQSTIRRRVVAAIRGTIPSVIILAIYITCRWLMFGRAFSITYGRLEPMEYAREFRVFERFGESLSNCFLPVNAGMVEAPWRSALRWCMGAAWASGTIAALVALVRSRNFRRYFSVMAAFFVVSFVPTTAIFWVDDRLFNSRFFYQPGLIALATVMGAIWIGSDRASGVTWLRLRLLSSALFIVPFAVSLGFGLGAFEAAGRQVRGLQVSAHEIGTEAERSDPNAVVVALGTPSQVAGVPTLEWYLEIVVKPPFFEKGVRVIPLLDVLSSGRSWHDHLRKCVTEEAIRPESLHWYRCSYDPPRLEPVFRKVGVASASDHCELVAPADGDFVATAATAPVFAFRRPATSDHEVLTAEIDGGRQFLRFVIRPGVNSEVDAEGITRWSLGDGSADDPATRAVWATLSAQPLAAPAAVIWSIESVDAAGTVVGRSAERRLVVFNGL